MKLTSLFTPAPLACAALIVVGTSSCSSPTKHSPVAATGTARNMDSESANILFAQAKNLETQGETKKAIKAYEKVATKYPLSMPAAEARYREASILNAKGELLESFNTYQKFIEKNNSSSLYNSAIQKQSEVAFDAAEGRIKHNFMGMKSKLGAQTVIKMLTQVRDNAPFSENAVKAQYLIGAVWEDRDNVERAIAGYEEVQKRYPNNSLTPEALYKTGTILMNESNKSNRNKANLDSARNVFLDLIQQFPNHPRAKDAKVKLAELSSTDVQRSFDIAEFYRQKDQNASAAFYYREVLRLSPSGELHDLAKQRLAETGQ